MSDSLKGFVESRAAAEGFSSAGEYVQSLLQNLRLSWENEQLERQLLIGIDQLDRGEGRTMSDSDWGRLHARIVERENGREAKSSDSASSHCPTGP
jgi:hypothetical protein